MATQTITELIDDVDGTAADETLTFGVDGATFEIDLNSANAEKLRDALDQFVAYARRIGGSARMDGRGGSLKPATRATPLKPVTRAAKVTHLPDVRPAFTTQERRSMQKFATAHGMKPPAERGRIAAAVSEAWEEAGRPT